MHRTAPLSYQVIQSYEYDPITKTATPIYRGDKQMKTTIEKLSDSFTMTKLENTAIGSKLTKDFAFIEKKDIVGHDLDIIVKIVNDRFKEKLSRGPVLYNTETSNELTCWSEQRMLDSTYKLSMYHLDELQVEKTPDKLPVPKEVFLDIMTRVAECGIA